MVEPYTQLREQGRPEEDPNEVDYNPEARSGSIRTRIDTTMDTQLLANDAFRGRAEELSELMAEGLRQGKTAARQSGLYPYDEDTRQSNIPREDIISQANNWLIQQAGFDYQTLESVMQSAGLQDGVDWAWKRLDGPNVQFDLGTLLSGANPFNWVGDVVTGDFEFGRMPDRLKEFDKNPYASLSFGDVTGIRNWGDAVYAALDVADMAALGLGGEVVRPVWNALKSRGGSRTEFASRAERQIEDAWEEMFGSGSADAALRRSIINERGTTLTGLELAMQDVMFDFIHGTGFFRQGAGEYSNMTFKSLVDDLNSFGWLQKMHPGELDKVLNELRRRGLNPDEYLHKPYKQFDSRGVKSEFVGASGYGWDTTAMTIKAKELDLLDVIEGRRVQGEFFHLRTPDSRIEWDFNEAQAQRAYDAGIDDRSLDEHRRAVWGGEPPPRPEGPPGTPELTFRESALQGRVRSSQPHRWEDIQLWVAAHSSMNHVGMGRLSGYSENDIKNWYLGLEAERHGIGLPYNFDETRGRIPGAVERRRAILAGLPDEVVEAAERAYLADVAKWDEVLSRDLHGPPDIPIRDRNELLNRDLSTVPEEMLPEGYTQTAYGPARWLPDENEFEDLLDTYALEDLDEEILDFIGVTHINGVPRPMGSLPGTPTGELTPESMVQAIREHYTAKWESMTPKSRASWMQMGMMDSPDDLDGYLDGMVDNIVGDGTPLDPAIGWGNLPEGIERRAHEIAAEGPPGTPRERITDALMDEGPGPGPMDPFDYHYNLAEASGWTPPGDQTLDEWLESLDWLRQPPYDKGPGRFNPDMYPAFREIREWAEKEIDRLDRPPGTPRGPIDPATGKPTAAYEGPQIPPEDRPYKIDRYYEKSDDEIMQEMFDAGAIGVDGDGRFIYDVAEMEYLFGPADQGLEGPPGTPTGFPDHITDLDSLKNWSDAEMVARPVVARPEEAEWRALHLGDWPSAEKVSIQELAAIQRWSGSYQGLSYNERPIWFARDTPEEWAQRHKNAGSGGMRDHDLDIATGPMGDTGEAALYREMEAADAARGLFPDEPHVVEHLRRYGYSDEDIARLLDGPQGPPGTPEGMRPLPENLGEPIPSSVGDQGSHYDPGPDRMLDPYDDIDVIEALEATGKSYGNWDELTHRDALGMLGDDYPFWHGDVMRSRMKALHEGFDPPEGGIRPPESPQQGPPGPEQGRSSHHPDRFTPDEIDEIVRNNGLTDAEIERFWGNN